MAKIKNVKSKLNALFSCDHLKMLANDKIRNKADIYKELNDDEHYLLLDLTQLLKMISMMIDF